MSFSVHTRARFKRGVVGCCFALEAAALQPAQYQAQYAELSQLSRATMQR
jgi:hypothetical protein